MQAANSEAGSKQTSGAADSQDHKPIMRSREEIRQASSSSRIPPLAQSQAGGAGLHLPTKHDTTNSPDAPAPPKPDTPAKPADTPPKTDAAPLDPAQKEPAGEPPAKPAEPTNDAPAKSPPPYDSMAALKEAQQLKNGKFDYKDVKVPPAPGGGASPSKPSEPSPTDRDPTEPTEDAHVTKDEEEEQDGDADFNDGDEELVEAFIEERLDTSGDDSGKQDAVSSEEPPKAPAEADETPEAPAGDGDVGGDGDGAGDGAATTDGAAASVAGGADEDSKATGDLAAGGNDAEPFDAMAALNRAGDLQSKLDQSDAVDYVDEDDYDPDPDPSNIEAADTHTPDGGAGLEEDDKVKDEDVAPLMSDGADDEESDFDKSDAMFDSVNLSNMAEGEDSGRNSEDNDAEANIAALAALDGNNDSSEGGGTEDGSSGAAGGDANATVGGGGDDGAVGADARDDEDTALSEVDDDRVGEDDKQEVAGGGDGDGGGVEGAEKEVTADDGFHGERLRGGDVDGGAGAQATDGEDGAGAQATDGDDGAGAVRFDGHEDGAGEGGPALEDDPLAVAAGMSEDAGNADGGDAGATCCLACCMLCPKGCSS